MFRDKGTMQNEITTLKKTNGDLTARISQLESSLTAVTAERDNLQAGFSRLETALAASNAENKDVRAEVTHQLGSAGVPESTLPKVTTSAEITSDDDQIAELNKQIEASKDPKERGRLSNQVWDLMKKSSSKIKVAAN